MILRQYLTRRMLMSKTTYISHPNPKYKGNPFIEALGYPLTQSQLQKSCEAGFDSQMDLSGTPKEHHGYYKRSLLMNLFDVRVCQDEAMRIYEVIRHSIEFSYGHRNPLSPKMHQLLAAIERDKEQPIKAVNIKRLNLFHQSLCYLLYGISGRGKSTMVGQVLQQIQQKIPHTEYRNGDGVLVACEFTQITYIYVEVADRKSQKSFLVSVIEAIDEAIDGYVTEIRSESLAYKARNYNASQLLTFIRKLVVMYAIGMVVIDEAQNIAKSPIDFKLGSNEKPSMKFIEEIFNQIGCSLFFIGTMATFDLFSKQMTTTRRAIRQGSMGLVSCDLNSSFWIRFCKSILKTEVLADQVTKESLLIPYLHEKTAGIPAIAISLVQSALSSLTFYPEKNQNLSIEFFDYIFDKYFIALQEVIDALNGGEYHLFEDLKPLLSLQRVKEKIQDDQLKDISNLMTGEVEEPPPQKGNKHEVDISKASEKIGLDGLMQAVSSAEDIS